jgi:ABC-type multidrug transport system fused ATPase/permease subunit
MPKNESPANPIWPSIRRLLKIAGPQSAWLYAGLAFDLLLAVTSILSIDFMRRIFDAVLAGQSSVFWRYTGLILALAVPNILFAYLKTRGIGQFSERTQAKLRQALAAHSTLLPVSYLEERHSGDLLSVLNADLAKLKTMLGDNFKDFFFLSVRFVFALTYIISINWLLALVSTILTPAIFLLLSRLTQPVSQRSEEMQDEIGQVNSLAQDSLSGAMVVKSFNLAGILDERFHQANQKALKKGLGIARYWAIVNGLGVGLTMLPFIIAMGLGGYLVIDKALTFGGLFAFINLLNYVVNPLASLPNVIASISEASGAAQRVFKLIDSPAERQDGAIIQPAHDSAPAIQFKDVSFAYRKESPILKHVSLDIPRGQTVAIVGPSGGGKTTLLKLILGYYPLPDNGVSLFGDDLNAWQLCAARQQMAFVAQDTYLFPVSLGENIACGRLGASQAEIERAARLANIHDFIASLPEGYATNAGEWGSRLSGGQKQRISLARAILKDAPILLLDEPTSALDAESEALIQEALDRFARQRTTMVVAHRLSTIKNADRVLVLQEGEIIEAGTHAELIAKGGLYLELYQGQYAPDALGVALDQPAAGAVGDDKISHAERTLVSAPEGVEKRFRNDE